MCFYFIVLIQVFIDDMFLIYVFIDMIYGPLTGIWSAYILYILYFDLFWYW